MFMKKNRSLNLKYAGSQIFYFAAFAAMMGYASVFLLDKAKYFCIISSLYIIPYPSTAYGTPYTPSPLLTHKLGLL